MDNILTITIIEDLILSNIEQIKSFNVQSLAVFGSFIRNQANPESDIDFLVNLSENTYRNYSHLRDFLEKLFGRKVDLICEDSLHELIKPYIIKDAKWLVN